MIVTDNLFGDILTDLAAAITGGIGLAASGNVNPDRTAPSMFEPVHGSAPDIAGQQKADPTAAILSTALLLDHLGLDDAARAVEDAVVADAGRRGRPGPAAARPRWATTSPPASPAEPLGTPARTPRRSDTVHSMPNSPLPIEVTPSTSPVGDDRLAEILADPGFGLHFTDHMFLVEWTPTEGWHDARVTPYAPLMLDPATAVLHYAQEIFEGMKAYRHEDGSVWTFRPEENAARLVRSAQRLALPELPVEDFVASVDAAGRAPTSAGCRTPAGEKSLYIRPFMFASEKFLGVRPAKHVTYMVIASPAGAYFAKGLKPVSIWLSEDYTRAGRGGMGAAKTGGNYASSLVAQQEAIDQGCDQVAFLDAAEGRYVEELGGMNLYFVHDDGTIVTPELSGTILEGITRSSIVELCGKLGYRIEERKFTVDEWRDGLTSGRLTEVFACGTAAVVTPVGTLKWRGGSASTAGSDDAIGPVTQQVRQNLVDIQYGRAEDAFGWMHRVV